MNAKLCNGTNFILSILFAAGLAFPAQAKAEGVKLELMSSGAMSKLGGYIPQRLALSETKPAGLRRAPKGLEAPLYGELKLGPKDAATTFVVILDEPAGKASRFWVDSNANGDATDDPAAEWKPKTST